MKKFKLIHLVKTVTILFVLCMFVAPSTGSAQTLNGYIWQLQNPLPFSNSEMLGFDSQGNFLSNITNVITAQKKEAMGTYRETSASVTFYFNTGQVFTFSLVWYNIYKVAMIYNGNTYYYAVSGSSEDNWFSNYLKSQSSGYSSGGSYNSYQQNTTTTCYTCRGTGSCTVCKGAKVYSNYGYSSPCSACGATGKCWHCHGTGIQ